MFYYYLTDFTFVNHFLTLEVVNKFYINDSFYIKVTRNPLFKNSFKGKEISEEEYVKVKRIYELL